LPKAKLARSAISWGKFVMPILLLAWFFVLAAPVRAEETVTWILKSPMPTARSGPATGVIDGKIYAAGGSTASGQALANLEAYDPKSDSWEVKPSMSAPRWGLASGIIDGKYYVVMGGSPVPYGSVKTEEYDPATNQWILKSDMPNPGWGVAAGVINNKLYVVGGYNWPNWGMNFNREYNPATNQWTLKAPMPTKRSWLAAEVIDNKFYAVGGWNWNDTADLPTLEVYDPASDSWTAKANLPVGLRNIATATLGGKLYVFGGLTGEGASTKFYASVYVYDPLTDAWTRLADLPQAIAGAAAEEFEGNIYLIGGSTATASLNTTYFWQIEKQINPVILVPGIMGSYLYSSIDPGVEVWPAVGKTVIDPWDLHLNQLIMDEQGKPSHNSMIVPPQDIIRSVLDKDFFAGLIEELKQNGYEEGKNLFVFPYDWRLDLNWSANGIPYSGFDSLKDKIEKIKLQTGAQKVNIIAHSMGGLVAKYYIKHYGSDSVNKFIDIGTPHLGAPEALKILMYGDDLGFNYLGLGLNLERIKLISQNFPSVYQLLPSRKYFDSVDQDYAYYFYDMHDLDGNGVTGRLNYAQSIDFMKNTGRNNNLLGFNDVLHSDLDNYSPQSAGVKTYNIMGCGQPTIGQIFILNKEKSGKYEYGLKYITGDGTVPLRSAQAIVADEDYYIRNTEHSTLPSAQGIKQLAKAILDETTADFPLLEYPAMSRNSAECSLTGTQISFHSPIELHVYDENNNHVGPNENGDIELGIAGAQYDDLDGNKFVFLPVGHDYRVVGQATDSEMFNARVQTVQDGQYVETVYYNQVPLDSVSTTVRMQINNGQQAGAMEIYEIDQSGNQILKTLVQPSSVLNQAEAADLAKPETQIEISGTGGTVESGGYYTSATTVALIATDIQGGSGILKTEYSLDNGLTWQNYNNNPIILNDSGEYRILYKATDKAGNIEEIKERKIKLDLIRPETQSNVSGSLGDNSFYISAASVTLTAVDQGGSGILKTEYSLDNGQAWQIYNGPVTLNIDGGFDLFYKSIDRAGNIEEVKEQKLKIDKISPVINILIPLETQEFTRDEFLTPEYEISDNYSGVDSNSLTLLIDNQQGKQDLFYCNLGEHVLKITVSDLAGNQAQASVKFTVSADLDSTIIDVNRSYSLGWISNKTVKGWLNEKLNEIKKYEAKFGERQKKLEQKRGKIMAQCLKKKNQAWCEKKLGKYYDKAVYKLNQIHQKIIAKRYQEILKKLEGYYKKQWLNQSAYGIIKADINYLISNL